MAPFLILTFYPKTYLLVPSDSEHGEHCASQYPLLEEKQLSLYSSCSWSRHSRYAPCPLQDEVSQKLQSIWNEVPHCNEVLKADFMLFYYLLSKRRGERGEKWLADSLMSPKSLKGPINQEICLAFGLQLPIPWGFCSVGAGHMLLAHALRNYICMGSDTC